MTINFYHYTGDYKVANKAALLPETPPLSMTGTLRDGCDVLRPEILLTTDVRNYNYCHIPEFGRYYWVKEYGDVTGTHQVLVLEVDPLTSWWAGLQECRCRVATTSDKTQINRNVKSGNVAIQQFTIPWGDLIDETDAGLGIDDDYVVVGIYG